MTPAQLRDQLRDRLQSPKPAAKVLMPWTKGHRVVTGFHVDDDGNLVLEAEKS